MGEVMRLVWLPPFALEGATVSPLDWKWKERGALSGLPCVLP